MVMSIQLQADKSLLEFETYEDYIDSLVTTQDLCLTRSTLVSRYIAELGYRSTGETLNRESFYRRRNAVHEVIYPTRKPYILSSEGIRPTDNLQKELALRERSNRVGILLTVIFVRTITKTGMEISGYIDYLDRLQNEDWIPFFEGKKKLTPKRTDLSYYHWRIGKSYSASTSNWKVIIDPIKGLLFKCRHDSKILFLDPNTPSPGISSTRQRIFCDKYENVVIYDHLIRTYRG